MQEMPTHTTVIEAPMTDLYVNEQIAAIEQRARFAPTEAYEVGHVVLPAAVEVADAPARPREAYAREVATEMWNSYSPFNAENTPMFGTDAEREGAMETVRSIANQARVTGKYFDGRHKALSHKLDAGEITADQHDEAVGGILAGLALTNPQHLRNVGEAQRNAIDRRVKAGALPEDTHFVDVTSRVTENGVELAGIDSVVARMTGKTTQAELAGHGLEIKRAFYGQEAMAKATARHEDQQAKLTRDNALYAAAHREQARRTIELLDRDEAKKKATSDNE